MCGQMLSVLCVASRCDINVQSQRSSKGKANKNKLFFSEIFPKPNNEERSDANEENRPGNHDFMTSLELLNGSSAHLVVGSGRLHSQESYVSEAGTQILAGGKNRWNTSLPNLECRIRQNHKIDKSVFQDLPFRSEPDGI